MKPNFAKVNDIGSLVMGSSWKFPSRAGHFNFRAETELDFFFGYIAFLAANFFFLVLQISQPKNHSFNNKKQYYSPQRTPKIK